MADAEKPIHRGNQAFIDEDYPATLQVSSLSHLSSRNTQLGFGVCGNTGVVAFCHTRRAFVLFARSGSVFGTLSLPLLSRHHAEI